MVVLKVRQIFSNNLETRYFQLILILMQFIHGNQSTACVGRGRRGRSKCNVLKILQKIVILRKNSILNYVLIFISKFSIIHCFFLYFSILKFQGRSLRFSTLPEGFFFFCLSSPSTGDFSPLHIFLLCTFMIQSKYDFLS